MAFQADIDWMWNDFGPPTKPGALACVIKLDVSNKPVTLRGNKSAHDCVVECIKAYRSGDQTAALNWLACGQWHNPATADGIKHAGNAALKHTLDTYGG